LTTSAEASHEYNANGTLCDSLQESSLPVRKKPLIAPLIQYRLQAQGVSCYLYA
jgi:hypothetical protein